MVSRNDFMLALETDIKPSFGTNEDALDNYMRRGIIIWDPSVQDVLDSGELCTTALKSANADGIFTLLLEGKGCMVDWLIGWVIDGSIDLSIDWSIDCSVDWLIDRSIVRSIDWLIDWATAFSKSWIFNFFGNFFFRVASCFHHLFICFLMLKFHFPSRHRSTERREDRPSGPYLQDIGLPLREDLQPRGHGGLHGDGQMPRHQENVRRRVQKRALLSPAGQPRRPHGIHPGGTAFLQHRAPSAAGHYHFKFCPFFLAIHRS